MIYEEIQISFSVKPPLFLPFFNRWGQNVYETDKAFSYDPFTIDASSTSGSPVVLAKNKFFGFLNESGGTVSFDGNETLTFTLEKGQKLYVNENCDNIKEWKNYNKLILPDDTHKNENFWSKLEYCTWVEQKKLASGIQDEKVWANAENEAEVCRDLPQKVLNEKFVYDYMDRIEKLGLPKGKLTIDDGWFVFLSEDGEYKMGDWEIDRNKFPHFEQMIKDIGDRGFVPGLWFSPFTSTECSDFGKNHPELLGGFFNAGRKWHHIKFDEEILRPHYTEIFTKYLSMGIKKLKLDISYGPKNDMIKEIKLLSEIIKSIAPETEIETHIPDIFASRYADTVRINDVAFDDEGKWRRVAEGHYFVCKNSAYNRIINLDHIGTNTPLPKAEDFLEHLEIQKRYTRESGGYPVVSLLPDFFDSDVCEKTVSVLNEMFLPNGDRKV